MKKQDGKISTAATSTERVSLAKPRTSAPLGALVIIRASELNKKGITGIVASGVLEKVEVNRYSKPGNLKNDYFIRNADGTLYIVNETKSLKDQLGDEGTLGLNVEVEYKGMIKTKAGADFHDFECFVIYK